jgi:Uri superfamily endonuclease
VSSAFEKLKSGQPGAYLLLIRMPRPARFAVGRLGQHSFPSGWYLYVGSALGPGGVAARVARHLRSEKRTYWHIDYVLRAGHVASVWIAFNRRLTECSIARRAQTLPGAVTPVPRFGASDCDCTTHLFRINRLPQAAQLPPFDLALSANAFRAAVFAGGICRR